jgi:hypothetical protein
LNLTVFFLISVIVLVVIYFNWHKMYDWMVMSYHKIMIHYEIWKAQRALRKINKGDIADAIRFDDRWEK